MPRIEGKAAGRTLGNETVLRGAFPQVAFLCVGIRELTVMADIGVHPHEIGRRQPLVVTAVLWIDPVANDTIDATIDYRDIAAAAETLAAQRIALIETFAHRLAEACLALPTVRRAQVTIDKPQALPSGVASVTTMLDRVAPPVAAGAQSCMVGEDA